MADPSSTAPIPTAVQYRCPRLQHPANEAIAVGAIILTVAVISILSLRRSAINSMVGEVNNCITQLADSAAAFVTTSALDDITLLVDRDTTEHRYILNHLNQMVQRVAGLEHAYIAVLIRDEPWFIIDASVTGHTDCRGHPFTHDGFPPPNPALLRALRAAMKSTTLDVVHETDHSFVTAYVPLHNSRGDVVAAVAIEMDARETRASIENIRRAARHAIFPALVMACAAGTLVYLIRRGVHRAGMREREIEKQLVTSEARFRSLVENIPLTVYRCALDEHSTMQYVSDHVENLTGYRGDEFIANRSRSYTSIIHTADCPHVIRVISQAVQQRRDYTVEYRILHRNGTIRWVTERGRAYYAPDGTPLHRDGTVTDHTKRKQAEQDIQDYSRALMAAYHALEQANTRTEAAAKAKMEFLANVSHEIRNPLTAILGFTEVLMEEKKDMPGVVERLQAIHRNSRHLLTIINDILDLSKIEAGRMSIESIEFSPFDILAEVYELMIGRAQQKQLGLHIEFQGQIPKTIRSDPTRLRQILINLIGNAIKFTLQGSVRIVTQLDPRTLSSTNDATAEFPSSQKPGKPVTCLRFDVIDTGIGVRTEKLDSIFHPFTQADGSMARVYGGTGLGLSISQRLAALLGGTIEAHSIEGAGSTFACIINPGSLGGVPLIDGQKHWDSLLNDHPILSNITHSPARVAPATFAISRESIGMLENCAVLLVEDGEDNQRLIAHWLEKAGALVEVAGNGHEAIVRIRSAMSHEQPAHWLKLPDVILMDLQMPVMDGYEATPVLRRIGFDRPIIAFTAHAMNEDRNRCLKALCDDFATKPINRKTLIALIRHHWNNKAQSSANKHAPTVSHTVS